MTNTIDSKSMSKSHTIQVPRELVEEWISRIWHEGAPVRVAASDLHLANEAAQWGWDQRESEVQEQADKELEAIEHWLITGPYGASIAASAPSLIADLRAAMRPSLSPVERVRSRLACLMDRIATEGAIATAEPIRECLEILDKLEAQQ